MENTNNLIMILVFVYTVIGFWFLELKLKTTKVDALRSSVRIKQSILNLGHSISDLILGIIKNGYSLVVAIINLVQTMLYILLWPVSYILALNLLKKINKNSL